VGHWRIGGGESNLELSCSGARRASGARGWMVRSAWLSARAILGDCEPSLSLWRTPEDWATNSHLCRRAPGRSCGRWNEPSARDCTNAVRGKSAMMHTNRCKRRSDRPCLCGPDRPCCALLFRGCLAQEPSRCDWVGRQNSGPASRFQRRTTKGERTDWPSTPVLSHCNNPPSAVSHHVTIGQAMFTGFKTDMSSTSYATDEIAHWLGWCAREIMGRWASRRDGRRAVTAAVVASSVSLILSSYVTVASNFVSYSTVAFISK
jgi:hypothetical protein